VKPPIIRLAPLGIPSTALSREMVFILLFSANLRPKHRDYIDRNLTLPRLPSTSLRPSLMQGIELDQALLLPGPQSRDFIQRNYAFSSQRVWHYHQPGPQLG
jgi:hypothetical protein